MFPSFATFTSFDVGFSIVVDVAICNVVFVDFIFVPNFHCILEVTGQVSVI